jgi:hypothetical protein
MAAFFAMRESDEGTRQVRDGGGAVRAEYKGRTDARNGDAYKRVPTSRKWRPNSLDFTIHDVVPAVLHHDAQRTTHRAAAWVIAPSIVRMNVDC